MNDPVRRILERASSHPRAEVEGIVARVPRMLAEAQRRRALSAAPEARIFAAARVFVPRLAAVTTALVLAALFLSSRSSKGGSTPAADSHAVERYILTGSADAAADPVLDALLRTEQR